MTKEAAILEFYFSSCVTWF